MFNFVRKANRMAGRLVADTVLTPENFQRIADEIGIPPIERPQNRLSWPSRTATKTEVVETRSNGKETTNTARPGDYIVTNLSPQREPLRDRDGHLNIYVIRAAKFPDLYEPAGERERARRCLPRQGRRLRDPAARRLRHRRPLGRAPDRSERAISLCNGREVYGVSKDAFDATYEVVAK